VSSLQQHQQQTKRIRDLLLGHVRAEHSLFFHFWLKFSTFHSGIDELPRLRYFRSFHATEHQLHHFFADWFIIHN
jgi:hypothetical protein